MKRIFFVTLLLGVILSASASEGQTSQSDVAVSASDFFARYWAYIVAIAVVWLLYFRMTKKEKKQKKGGDYLNDTPNKNTN